MNCPKCGILTVKLGVIQCATGDAEKRGCPRCRGIWFVQVNFRLCEPPDWRRTVARLAAGIKKS